VRTALRRCRAPASIELGMSIRAASNLPRKQLRIEER
jgi:hypothetical protein